MASTESSDDESPKSSSSETVVENNTSPMTPDRRETLPLPQSSRDLTPEKLQRLPLMSHENNENGSMNGSDISEGDSSEPGTVSGNEPGDSDDESENGDDPSSLPLDDVRLGICDGYGGFFCPHCGRRTQQPYHMCVQALVSDDDDDGEELLSASVNDNENRDEELSLPDDHPHDSEHDESDS